MPESIKKKSAEAVGRNVEEIIYDSPPSETDDDLWLAQGAKMLEESVPGVRNAASELIKALGLLQTVYLGILGFAKFIPENMEVYNKAFFIVPIIPWVFATFYCLRVVKTDIFKINLCSPSEIRKRVTALLEEKQRNLENAFAFLVAGIVLAFVMVVFRLRI